LRAVLLASLGVELSHLAGDALADDASLFVDQDAHEVLTSQEEGRFNTENTEDTEKRKEDAD